MALTNFLKDIADAIRYAEQSTAPINAQNFATRIRALSGGGASGLSNITVLGDSYVAYKGYNQGESGYVYWFPNNEFGTQGYNFQNGIKSVDDMWWKKLADHTTLSIKKIDGYSGACISNLVSTTNSFIARAENLDNDGDILLLTSGLNDIWSANVTYKEYSALGELQYENWTDADKAKPLNGICYLFNYLTTQKNYKHIAFIGYTSKVYKNDTSGTYYVNTIKSACEHYGIDYIDVQPMAFYQGHPSWLGMTQIANACIEKFATYSDYDKVKTLIPIETNRYDYAEGATLSWDGTTSTLPSGFTLENMTVESDSTTNGYHIVPTTNGTMGYVLTNGVGIGKLEVDVIVDTSGAFTAKMFVANVVAEIGKIIGIYNYQTTGRMVDNYENKADVASLATNRGSKHTFTIEYPYVGDIGYHSFDNEVLACGTTKTDSTKSSSYIGCGMKIVKIVGVRWTPYIAS